MLITPRSFGCLISIIAAVMLNSGCAKDDLNEREVRAVCMNLGAGGWYEAVSVAKQAGITDETKLRPRSGGQCKTPARHT